MGLLLDDTTAGAIRAFFDDHPVLGQYAGEICFALTGSYAVSLGGKGADVDVTALCPPPVYEAVRRALIDSGRIGPEDDPEEEFPTLVGDYSLQSLADVWRQVQNYDDMTALFIYGNLIYLSGRREFLDPLVSHCRLIPAAVLEREADRERLAFSQGLYAFLRSFQNEDPVARLLARAGLVRSALRLAFLLEGCAPPYDKHLFRLLPQRERGLQVAGLIQEFLAQSDAAAADVAYAPVAATTDWHAMYEAARETPVVRFSSAVHSLLDNE